MTQGSTTVMDYTVTDKGQTLTKVGGFYTPDSGMTFVVVPMSVTLRSQQYVHDIDTDICLLTTDGAQYFTDTSAEMFYTMPDGSDDPLWLPTLKVDETVQGALIYQVPSSMVSGAVLVIGLGTPNLFAIDLQLP